jgi:sec-independent protein translocase protein TatC
MRFFGFGGSDSNDEGPAEGDEVVPESSLVYLWLCYENAAEQAALLMAAIREVGDFNEMSTLNVTEAFIVYFKVCLLCGLVIGSPWIFYQIWAFVAAGLYPHEKRLVHVYLPVSLGLFLIGVFFCQIVVIPRAIAALLWFNEWIGLKPDLRLNEWLSFALLLPVVFGASFQTPLVMMFLDKLGVCDINTFRGHRRIIWFLLAAFSAIITPTPDAITMIALWVPMGLLFELGIWLVSLSPRSEFESDLSESDDLVEV